MADFLDSEAESDNSDNEDMDPHERKKLKKLKAMSDSEDDDEDDEDRLREELKDLIDDAPIEEGSDAEDSDASGREKRKKSDDEDEMDDRLEDDDYDLIEENLGVKVQRRKRFKRLKRVQIEDSDGEQEVDDGMERDTIANQLFDGDDDHDHRQEEESRRSVSGQRTGATGEAEQFAEEEEDDEESDADDFIVDDDGRPITEKKKKSRRIFNDAHLQEGQDIFGVDFDYDEFEKYDEDEYEDESEAEDEYEEDGVDGEQREKRPKKTAKKKPSKKSIFEIYEPSELKRGHFTDLDNEIRRTDIPERMQLREVPLTPVPENSTELDEEAEWIYKQAFIKSAISTQETLGPDGRERPRKPSSAIGKIKQALEFMRNQQLEVPFIAFYRKEYVQPELNINDLWKVYNFDAKWCQLHARRKTLKILFEKMRSYQMDKIMENAESTLPDDIRIMKEEDIDRLRYVQTQEELKDVHTHFLLHYSHEISNMNDAWRIKEKKRRREERREARRKEIENLEEGAEPPPEILSDDDDEQDNEQPVDKLKPASTSDPYAKCRTNGLLSIAKRFGLTPEQYAENLCDNYQKHECEQESIELTELAREYVDTKKEYVRTVDDVLKAAKFVVAREIASEPALRKSVRETFFERAKLSVKPTKKGQKEIDENHNCYTVKYLKNKPVRDLVGEQFLRLCMAEDDKLLEIAISEKIEGNTSGSYLDEMKNLYQRDEFSKNVQEWNAFRQSCVEVALNRFVLPDMRKELKSHLLAEAKDAVLRLCCRKLYNWIKIAPYSCDFSEEDDYEWDTSKGIRVMALAYVPDYTQSAFCALARPGGSVEDFLKIPHILKRKNSYRTDEKEMKEADLLALKNWIRNKKPHVIVIGGESRDALMIQQDLREIIKELIDDEQFPNVAVEIVENELAKIYSNSQRSIADFRDWPHLLRQAASLARKVQDPLVEYSQLCTHDEEILCLRYHSLQEQLPKEYLLENLYLEFINRTNEVGVDINLAVQNSLTVNLVQFICGLGPRKGQALIKILKQTNQRLENRTQLVTACHMGPKVFINCSGFIKIDTNSLGDSTEAYVEVLDGSRVHPETYEWARKMAVDALEYDDEDANPAGALEEILEAPERLRDLDLDAFAVELERQGFGNKSITLYDIRAELNSRYKDLRTPYRPPTAEELFDILTKETPETFYVGKIILAKVVGFSHRKPQGEQLDQANPVRNDETNLWQCPFCLDSDFPELSEVWNHFDAGSCPGQATGVRLRLDNELSGFIHIKNLSDKHVKNPEERVRVNQGIHVRITKIDVERFAVDCTSKSSDLMDRNHEWRPTKDHYYDQELEDQQTRKEDDSKKQKNRQQYVKRIIVHQAFHNIAFRDAIKMMQTMDQGAVIVRPSSKGSDHLTVTWKVTDDIYQHIDVREEGKENAFCLGQTLWIGNDEFEDLEEIITRHVTPMAGFATELLTHKYYRHADGGVPAKLEELLRIEKERDKKKIHYFLSASKKYPGQFLLSYLPRAKVEHEIITLIPDGFMFRQQKFISVSSLLEWFKEHYTDPIPRVTPINTPRGASTSSTRNSYATPALSNSSSDAIHRVAQNMPSHMLHSLSQVASQTPHYPHTPGGHGTSYINTPYTPSGQTPFMTPYATPHHTPHHSAQTPRYSQTTPRYGQSTPSSDNGQFLQPGPPIGSRGRGGGSGHMPPPQGSPYGSSSFRSPRMGAPSPHSRNNNFSSMQQQNYGGTNRGGYSNARGGGGGGRDNNSSGGYQQRNDNMNARGGRGGSTYNQSNSNSRGRGNFSGASSGTSRPAAQDEEDWDEPDDSSANKPNREGSQAGTPRDTPIDNQRDSGRASPRGGGYSNARGGGRDYNSGGYQQRNDNMNSRGGRGGYNQNNSRGRGNFGGVSSSGSNDRRAATQDEEDWDEPDDSYANKPKQAVTPRDTPKDNQRNTGRASPKGNRTPDWDDDDDGDVPMPATNSNNKSNSNAYESAPPAQKQYQPQQQQQQYHQKQPQQQYHQKQQPQHQQQQYHQKQKQQQNDEEDWDDDDDFGAPTKIGGNASPPSIRSTPRTNTSPHSMNMGDSTPLYDEN